jgi:hypothetical protein
MLYVTYSRCLSCRHNVHLEIRPRNASEKNAIFDKILAIIVPIICKLRNAASGYLHDMLQLSIRRMKCQHLACDCMICYGIRICEHILVNYTLIEMKRGNFFSGYYFPLYSEIFPLL